MPTTTYVTPTVSANIIGARTDASGGAVTDTTAEEARFPSAILTEGYLTPATAFKVAAQAVPDMTVKVGSGVAKADYYVVAGEVAGQGNYIVRLDVASQNMTIDAADASQTRTDEIYLVVRDNPYDASARALPQLSYRKGDLGGANPGADAAWRASVLLARITVAAAATTITNAVIADSRLASGGYGIQSSIADAKGDMLVATAADTFARLAVGTNGQVHIADSTQATGTKWAAPVAVASQYVAPLESTTSGSFTDLTTPGPAATVVVGPLGIALVSVISGVTCDFDEGVASFAVSGANTIAALDENSVQSKAQQPIGEFVDLRAGSLVVLTGLTPGSTTFTMKYKANSGTAGFYWRKIGVVTF